MSDIFISYSKADHALALKLSAFLEAEGWSVWWDKSLGAADLYRDEIMKQLAAARAVVTIWTESSIKSDWVRAEAGAAKAQGKLIPVKTADVAYGDIPLPFGEMHTENVGSKDLIRAAIVAQLTKPATPKSPFWQITSTFKYQVLTWIGIIGTAITLFANISGILNLADWARVVVRHWHDWTELFWGWVFGLFNVNLPRELVPIISFVVFVAFLIVGLNRFHRIATQSSVPQQFSRKNLRIFFGGVLLYVGTIMGLPLLVSVAPSMVTENMFVVGLMLLIPTFIFPIFFPLGYVLYFRTERPWIVLNSILFLFVSVFLLIAPLAKMTLGTILTPEAFARFVDPEFRIPKASYVTVALLSGGATIILLQICWMAVMLFSPVRQLTQRLGFVVLGVITLIGLNEISKLNLHQYLQPPKVSENSVC
jgi:TIR domain